MDEAGVRIRWFRPLTRLQVHKANHDPPEGADRRRSGRVHRRGRHRRRMEGRRAQRARVARYALPPSRTGGGRPSGRIPRQLARDGRRPVRGIGRPLPRPTAGRFEPRPVRPRRLGARLERHLDAVPGVGAARTGADPDRDSVLRPRHAAERTARRGRAARREVEILLPGPHADKRFVQLAGESSFEHLLNSGIRICASSRRCCTRRS